MANSIFLTLLDICKLTNSSTPYRPLAGTLNFNPDEISLLAIDHDLQYMHTIRESIHILGFSRALFTLFKHANGT